MQCVMHFWRLPVKDSKLMLLRQAMHVVHKLDASCLATNRLGFVIKNEIFCCKPVCAYVGTYMHVCGDVLMFCHTDSFLNGLLHHRLGNINYECMLLVIEDDANGDT